MSQTGVKGTVSRRQARMKGLSRNALVSTKDSFVSVKRFSCNCSSSPNFFAAQRVQALVPAPGHEMLAAERGPPRETLLRGWCSLEKREMVCIIIAQLSAWSNWSKALVRLQY